MKAIDLEMHSGTGVSAMFWGKSEDEIRAMEKQYKRPFKKKTPEEAARDFISADVKGVLIEECHHRTLDQIHEVNDFHADLIKRFPDAFLSAWCCPDPDGSAASWREAERCLKDLHFLGLAISGYGSHRYIDDRSYYPFYYMAWEAKVPVLVHVGTTGLGAGRPGGSGIRLDHTRPIPYLDNVAADFPELTIIASRPAYPFQDEMNAVLVHKANVYNELHGWAPKYFTQELKNLIRTRLQDKIMFGSDYPIFSLDNLMQQWKDEGYPSEILEKVFVKNAMRVLGVDEKGKKR